MFKQHKYMDATTAQAVEDVIDTVGELGQVASQAIHMEEGTPQRRYVTHYVQELYERVESRARSAGIDGPTLLNHAADRISAGQRCKPVDITDLLRAA